MSNLGPNNNDGRDSAFALFAVLSFLLLAATISIPFVTSARTQALIARNVAADLKDRMAVRGLIEISANRLFKNARQQDFVIPRSVACRFEQEAIKISFQNHAGLIDLNSASADLLKLGFSALGAGASDALNLAQAVIQFRTIQTGSATVPLLQIRGGYKHALFESVTELLDIAFPISVPMTEIVNIFTVHSATGTLLDVAVSEALKERLRELPPTATYFVVSGQQPLSAVTISVEIARLGKNKVLASVIARLNGADSAVEFVSPVTVNWQPETIAVAERWPSSCSNFFKASELSAIKMLIGGTV